MRELTLNPIPLQHSEVSMDIERRGRMRDCMMTQETRETMTMRYQSVYSAQPKSLVIEMLMNFWKHHYDLTLTLLT